MHRVPSGGVTTFGPLIVKSFGFNAFNTILLNIPFGAVQIIATLGGAAFATWTRKKGPALALLCLPPIIGCSMLLTITHTVAHRGPLLLGYYLISFYPGISEYCAFFGKPVLIVWKLLSSILGRLKTQPERPRRRQRQHFSSLARALAM